MEETGKMGERAMNQPAKTGIDFDEYVFAEEAGMSKGRLVAKMWGRKRNLISYYEMEDGRKLKFSTWYTQDYLWIDKIPIGASVMIAAAELRIVAISGLYSLFNFPLLTKRLFYQTRHKNKRF
jgi:hypothetical protein